MTKDSYDQVLSTIQGAEIVIPCSNFEETFAFFTEGLGFSVAVISPADNPSVGVLEGYGIRIRIEQGTDLPSHTLRLNCDLTSFASAGAELLLIKILSTLIVAVCEPRK